LKSLVVEEADKKKHAYFTFVFASGRSTDSEGQIGLVCDALGTPEIALSLRDEVYKDCRLTVDSLLDIDMLDEAMAHINDASWPKRPHMILCATGDINIMVKKVLEPYVTDNGLLVRPGPIEPKSDELVGLGTQHTFRAQTEPNGGCLVAFANPWWKDRIVFLCGGIHGIGTVGALWLLNEYLIGNGQQWGNNLSDPNVPGKLFESIEREYKNPIKEFRKLVPPHDVCNLTTKFPKLKFSE